LLVSTFTDTFIATHEVLAVTVGADATGRRTFIDVLARHVFKVELMSLRALTVVATDRVDAMSATTQHVIHRTLVNI